MRYPVEIAVRYFKAVSAKGIALFGKAARTVKRNGIRQSARLIGAYFIWPPVMRALPTCAKLYLRAWKYWSQFVGADQSIRYWRPRKTELLSAGADGYRLAIDELGLEPGELERLRSAAEGSSTVVIADVDQDSFFLSRVGEIPHATLVPEAEFIRRKRFGLQMVALNGVVGIRKDYRGDKRSFANELTVLHRLAKGGCRVPSLLDVDFDNLALTFSYIPGTTLRERLAGLGAILTDRDVERRQEFRSLTPKQRELTRIAEGKKVLPDAVDSAFVEDLFEELSRIQAAGVVSLDVKYGNVVIEAASGKPFLIDFDGAHAYSGPRGMLFRVLCDRDVAAFNLHFATDHLTYEGMQKRVDTVRRQGVYAPIYFGAGLRLGPIWSVANGYGRWHYILKRALPALKGKRILDLGANNAFVALQTLRNGAQETIGVELGSEYIEQGLFVKEGFEWIDRTRYNFRYIQANMKDVPSMDLGTFDLVFALCSIYYLDDEDIAAVIRHVSTLTDVFVLQCNLETHIGRSEPHVYEKASVGYIERALRANGFPVTETVAPQGYSHPLVFGKKENAAHT